jgi:hypothetical protein
LLQNNDITLSAIHDALDERTFEQIKNIEIAHDAWKKLKESFEGTQAVKGAKAYILKEKFTSFKMKEDENVPEMFYRLQVLVVTPIFKEQMECIILCAPRDKSHISRQIKDSIIRNVYYITNNIT